MLEVLAAVTAILIEEIIGRAFTGALRRSRSVNAMWLKFLARSAFVVGLICFLTGVVLANNGLLITACFLGLLFFAFAIAADVVNGMLRSNDA